MRPLIRRPLALVALAMGTLLACTDSASITQIPIDPVVVVDTANPTAVIGTVKTPAEVGDTVFVTFHDDLRLSRAHLVALDSSNRVAWRSPQIDLPATGIPDTGKSTGYSVRVGIPLAAFPDTFPYGHALNYVAWVQDAAGHASYGKTSGQKDSTAADKTPITIGDGRTVFLPSGSVIRSLAFDSAGHRIYFSDSTHNLIRSLRTDSLTLSNKTTAVGSFPGVIGFQRSAFGGRPVLVSFNSGSASVSVIDLASTGEGTVRNTIQLPVLTATVGPDKLPLAYTASSVLFYCPTTTCDQPVLYFGNPARSATGVAGTASKGVTRSLSLTSTDQLANLGVLAPDYNAALASDKAVTVTVTESSRATQQDSVVFTRDSVSQCGTLAFGSTTLVSSEDQAGPIFLAELGSVTSTACGSSARVLRYDRTPAGGYTVSPTGIFNVDVDPATTGVQSVDVNADASLALLVSANKVVITTGTFQRIGTVVGTGITGAAFLKGQRGGPGSLASGGIFAVAATDGITIYETEHFTSVAHYAPANAITGKPIFVRTNPTGGVLILGPSKGGAAFTALQTSLTAIAVRRP